jgi:uncharacterized protein (DUF433 family)
MSVENSAPVELALAPQSIPLTVGAGGFLNVSGTRVSLDCVVHAFEEGETPEGIVERYPTLGLADVYQVLAYYLRHPKVVAAYLAEQEKRADEVARRIEKQFGSPAELHARLLGRRRAVNSVDKEKK